MKIGIIVAGLLVPGTGAAVRAQGLPLNALYGNERRRDSPSCSTGPGRISPGTGSITFKGTTPPRA